MVSSDVSYLGACGFGQHGATLDIPPCVRGISGRYHGSEASCNGGSGITRMWISTYPGRCGVWSAYLLRETTSS